MIKHHPQQALLDAHAQAQLPLSMTIAVAAHCEMCPTCQQYLEQRQDYIAAQTLTSADNCTDDSNGDEIDLQDDWSTMIDDITALPPEELAPFKPDIVEIKQRNYHLPRAFKHRVSRDWSTLGKISRMRLGIDENDSRASLLHIDAGGDIPEHGHGAQEMTLLLAGEFSDEYNQYQAGDFIVLDKNHKHSPSTIEGCLCYTVVDAPLHFTKGISKLLNPIGKLIY
ncbi:ChrR family anti-sigma-E factor [Shewanella gelidii]|uniref:Anti-ECF sigma factor ChrR n=1 Tax=Shewanella gelidii TaxID=1642821 RepID=A0A917JMI9_9GAMM|nr:ChrR family anti-sigma-E factor [Shewanella gelidii]MCL1099236.1 ChrR family anti-sigma-E factor [Shewanella gelidii]GGI76653.1 anti-ECF sigma factor ChrR [Shewanella gelidii]